jgi:sugar lactone lactonase YvrE
MTAPATLHRHAEAPSAAPAGRGFEVYDAEFEAVLGDGAHLELVAETDAHEGPVYVAGEDALYFTTLPRAGSTPAPGTPRAIIKRLALTGLSFPVDESRLSVLPAAVHMPNGMTLGRDGHLVVCEQGTRSDHARISRVDRATGRAEALVEGWRGLRLNSPNDVVVRHLPRPAAAPHPRLRRPRRHPSGGFGGPAGDGLFITTDTAIWAAVLNPAAGADQRRDQAPGRW